MGAPDTYLAYCGRLEDEGESTHPCDEHKRKKRALRRMGDPATLIRLLRNFESYEEAMHAAENKRAETENARRSSVTPCLCKPRCNYGGFSGSSEYISLIARMCFFLIFPA